MWGMEGGSYATLQLVPVIVTLFAYLPMAGLAVRIGRKKTVIAGGLLLIIAYGALFFSGKFSPVLYVYMSMIGIGMAAVSINVYPMIMEISTPETTGKYTGYYYTASMTAQIITPVLSGAVMEFIGYRYLFLYDFRGNHFNSSAFCSSRRCDENGRDGTAAYRPDIRRPSGERRFLFLLRFMRNSTRRRERILERTIRSI